MASLQECCRPQEDALNANYRKCIEIDWEIRSLEREKSDLMDQKNKKEEKMTERTTLIDPNAVAKLKAELTVIAVKILRLEKTLGSKYPEQHNLIKLQAILVEDYKKCTNEIWNKAGCNDPELAEKCCENIPAHVLRLISGRNLPFQQGVRPTASPPTTTGTTGTSTGTNTFTGTGLTAATPGTGTDSGTVGTGTGATQGHEGRVETAPNGGQTVRDADAAGQASGVRQPGETLEQFLARRMAEQNAQDRLRNQQLDEYFRAARTSLLTGQSGPASPPGLLGQAEMPRDFMMMYRTELRETPSYVDRPGLGATVQES